jgi:hypothetical protein
MCVHGFSPQPAQRATGRSPQRELWVTNWSKVSRSPEGAKRAIPAAISQHRPYAAGQPKRYCAVGLSRNFFRHGRGSGGVDMFDPHGL